MFAEKSLPLDVQLGRDIVLNLKLQHFFSSEAHLLDDRRFDEWLKHVADDIVYVAPSRINRPKADDRLSDFLPVDQGAHFNENKATLTLRVKKIGLKSSWSEDPRTRTRLIVSNVIARSLETPGTFESASYFQYYRSRISRPTTLLVGKRVDRVREASTPLGYEIFGREIYFDHDVLHSGGVTTFL